MPPVTPEQESIDRRAQKLSGLSLFDWYTTTHTVREHWREKVGEPDAE